MCCPIEVQSIGGARYFVTFIDRQSRWTEVYAVKLKSEVFDCFKDYMARAERETSNKIKTLRSDGGEEYVNIEFKTFLKDHGIKTELTCPYFPQQNGIAEQMNRTIMETVRCMPIQKSVSKRFWAEATVTPVYIKTGYELDPSITMLHQLNAGTDVSNQ